MWVSGDTNSQSLTASLGREQSRELVAAFCQLHSFSVAAITNDHVLVT